MWRNRLLVIFFIILFTLCIPLLVIYFGIKGTIREISCTWDCLKEEWTYE